MRKGDEKRQELLDAAEKLFCQKGYEATSIQDVLNVTAMSKGGFYHHFAGKEEIFRGVCERRAQQGAGLVQQALADAPFAMARINAVLHGAFSMNRDEQDLAAVLLPMMGRTEGRAVVLAYQEARMDAFQPLLQQEMNAAAAAEVIYPPVQGMERPILHLLTQGWLEVGMEASRCTADADALDAQMLLSGLERYRRAVEVLLDAPFGSVEIITLEELTAVLRYCIAEK